MEHNGDFYGGLFGMSSVLPNDGFSIQPKSFMPDNETVSSSGADSLFSNNPYVGNPSSSTRSVTDNSLYSMQRSVLSSLDSMHPNTVKDSIYTLERTATIHRHNNDSNSSSSTIGNRLALASEQTLLCAAALLQNQAHQDAKSGSNHANPVTGQRKPFVYTEFNAIPTLPLELGGICHPSQISPDVFKRELMIETPLTDDIVAGIIPTVNTIFR